MLRPTAAAAADGELSLLSARRSHGPESPRPHAPLQPNPPSPSPTLTGRARARAVAEGKEAPGERAASAGPR
eukprot:scaffold266_cov391-Prasinococcus_capsulatus_cf.AAC.1